MFDATQPRIRGKHPGAACFRWSPTVYMLICPAPPNYTNTTFGGTTVGKISGGPEDHPSAEDRTSAAHRIGARTDEAQRELTTYSSELAPRVHAHPPAISVRLPGSPVGAMYMELVLLTTRNKGRSEWHCSKAYVARSLATHPIAMMGPRRSAGSFACQCNGMCPAPMGHDPHNDSRPAAGAANLYRLRAAGLT